MKLKTKWVIAALLTLAGAVALATRLVATDAPTSPSNSGRQDCSNVTQATCTLAHSLGRGINLGNMLEAPREGDWGVELERDYIDIVARHFTTVRLPVRWSNHAARTADATIDEKFARRVDGVVDALLARGVNVILNVHHYNQLSGSSLNRHEFEVDPAVVETRFLNLWKQIAQRYQDRPQRLVFELLNEPSGRLDGEPWNRLAEEALAVVRASNPDRTVMIGPAGYNHVRELPRLRLPRDRNLIVPVHLYDPFDFTHQGVTWRPKPMPTGITCCDAGQRRAMTEKLAAASRWNREHGVPLHLGEFGVYHAADAQSRAAWARHMRNEAERRGIGWTWWEFGADFGVWSPETGTWVEPLREALLD